MNKRFFSGVVALTLTASIIPSSFATSTQQDNDVLGLKSSIDLQKEEQSEKSSIGKSDETGVQNQSIEETTKENHRNFLLNEEAQNVTSPTKGIIVEDNRESKEELSLTQKAISQKSTEATSLQREKNNGVEIADENLKSAILNQLNLQGIEVPNEVITAEMMEKLTELDYRLNFSEQRTNKVIKKLDGIQFAKHLKKLYLGYNSIVDLSPLQGLTELEVLDLDNQYSSKGEHYLVNIDAISKLTNLKELLLDNNQITDVSALSSLVNLEILNLYRNKVENINGFENLQQLTVLDLGRNSKIKDISPLANCIKLKKLHVYKNDIENISAVANMTELTDLSFYNNKVQDISAVANLTNLVRLDAQGNKITSIDAVKNLENLEDLYLNRNQISDISPLENLTKLKELGLYSNKVEEISVLSKLQALENLNLGRNTIKDFAPIGTLKNLEELKLSGCGITDLSFLKNNMKLTELDLQNNKITDLKPIKGIYKLHELKLGQNKITDISPLSELNENTQYEVGAQAVDIEGYADIIHNPLIDINGKKQEIKENSTARNEQGYIRILQYAETEKGKTLKIQWGTSSLFNGTFNVKMTKTEHIILNPNTEKPKDGFERITFQKGNGKFKNMEQDLVFDVKKDINWTDDNVRALIPKFSEKEEHGTYSWNPQIPSEGSIEKMPKTFVAVFTEIQEKHTNKSRSHNNSSSPSTLEKAKTESITRDLPTTVFDDIKGKWFEDDVNQAVKMGIFKGEDEHHFNPYGKMTRGMFVTVIGRWLNAPTDIESDFRDVNKNVYYYPYISWAKSVGIIDGTDKNTFSPNDILTREQLAVVLDKVMERNKVTITEKDATLIIEDNNQISPYARASVEKLMKAGILKGTKKGVFMPKRALTRAEMASIMMRIKDMK